MELPFEQSNGRTGRKYAELLPAGHKRRQVMDMDAYQIIMICIASVTLVLKLIEFYHNINRK